jgi:pyruvate/2-oxoglutarate dehydrogenase complex dihydrolipoamide dehydrogenase (E3) component
MVFDYDLVIIGGSLAARYAAAAACRLKARVALVEPDTTQTVELPVLRHCAFRQLRSLLEQTWKTELWGLGQISIAPHPSCPMSWENALKWVCSTTEMIAANESIGYSLSQLAAAGVDVVLGQAVFYPASKRKQRSFSAPPSRLLPVVSVNQRYLRSRSYLLAPTTEAVIPPIEGLATIPYRTIDTFWQSPWPDLPRHLMILGSDPRGIELAQLFNRLGCQVSLIVSGTQLLPDEDAKLVALLQAHLEAEGIQILTQTRVTQAKQLGEQTWIQAGDRALQTDALLLSTQRWFDIAALNLEAVGVKGDRGVWVNRKLQTTNPRIYACGEVLGGYALTHLAEYEADIALRNALFYPTSSVNYGQIPWTVFTSPSLGRLGLTEAQAKAFYGRDVMVLQHSLQPLSCAQVQQETIGCCKLIVRRNGEIVGAHSLSPQAEEWISAMALAMKHHIKLGAIEPSAFVASTFSEILAHLIRQWRHQRRPGWQQDLLESWFNLRRS